LANVVDDHLMKISHVIRAEEWISSTPKHVQLYKAFGWEPPVFVHMPLLRNSDQSKISKRKNPVSLTYYRRAGIMPEALLNFLALMGWSFGGDREIFTIPEMLTVFDIKNISLGGPVFDLVKLTWLNQHYMHKMNEDQFVSYIRDEIFNADFLKKLKPLALERMSRWEQFVDNNSFFFNGALNYTHIEILPAGKTKEQLIAVLDELVTRLDDLYEWEAPKIDALLQAHKAETGWKPKDYFMTLRLVTTGRKDSPPLAESLEVIGREMVRFRLRDYMRHLQAH
jgi:glutamyl-tRNA synthetase